MEAAQDVEMTSPQGEPPERPRHLQPATPGEPPVVHRAPGGGGGGSADAGEIVQSLRASADQEFHIAERLSTKARLAFALAAGVFTVAQTVAFGDLEVSALSTGEKRAMIVLAILSVLALGAAAWAVLNADDLVESGDLPLAKVEDDLNAAYEGDADVMGRLGSYYLGIVQSRRDANRKRREFYKFARLFVGVSLFATSFELIVSLIARTS